MCGQYEALHYILYLEQKDNAHGAPQKDNAHVCTCHTIQTYIHEVMICKLHWGGTNRMWGRWKNMHYRGGRGGGAM